jgi:hypothetical protein
MTAGIDFEVTVGDLVALERHLGRPVIADQGAGIYSVESAAWLTWRHRGEGRPFEEWLDNGADVPYTEVIRQAALLLGFDPDQEATPANVDPSNGGAAPPPD